MNTYDFPLYNTLPDSMRFTAEEQSQLDKIKIKAKDRHNKARKAAKASGRDSFPELPYECSWAFENEFMRESRSGVARFEQFLIKIGFKKELTFWDKLNNKQE